MQKEQRMRKKQTRCEHCLKELHRKRWPDSKLLKRILGAKAKEMEEHKDFDMAKGEVTKVRDEQRKKIQIIEEEGNKKRLQE